MKLIINAANIHQGGGKTLLLPILEALPRDRECFVILDERLDIPDKKLEGLKIRRVKPSIASRLFSEWRLKGEAQSNDIVHCFGNLPPLFKLKARVSVLLQNRYMVENLSLFGFTLWARLRIMVERLWFVLFATNVDEFIVQIPSMEKLLKSKLNKKHIPISVMPFVESTESHVLQSDKSADLLYDFLYVASGEPHKNHRRLIDAWCCLASEGLFPRLCLTIEEEGFPELCEWMKIKKVEYNLKLVNVGSIPYHEVQKLYKRVNALIYPTIFESLGLALIEAQQVGLPIIASELDFVRDILDPCESFSPYSALSLSRAVKRFLGVSEKRVRLSSASQLINYIARRS